MSNSNSFFASNSYQRTTKIIFICGAILSLIGLLFKIMHYPGSEIPLPLGLMLVAIASVFIAFQPIELENEESKRNSKLLIFYRYSVGYGVAIFSIGGLFHIQHYPGGNILLPIGFLTGIFCLLFSLYITFSKSISLSSIAKLNSALMLTFFIWGASGYFMRVSKSILNSFVALNDQIEQNAENELVYGNLKLDLFKNKKTDIDLEKKLDYINQIDKITAEQIKYLDAIKIEILTEIKEDPAKMKAGDPHSIITNSYEDKSPLRPIRMNLENVMNKDKYDEVMRIFGIAENPNKPTTYKCKSSNVSGGIELWNNLLKFRNDLCSIVVASSSNDSVKNNFIDPKIIKFKDIEDLQKNVQNAFSKCKINADSYPFLEEIYISLTKNEICEDEQYPEGLHWLGKTFNHAPSISAIATLSNLQKEILTARKIAISSIVNN